MSPERITLLATDLWTHVFTMLDAEPEINGDEAGRIATLVERAFEAAMEQS